MYVYIYYLDLVFTYFIYSFIYANIYSFQYEFTKFNYNISLQKVNKPVTE